jgi:hypothetical protein
LQTSSGTAMLQARVVGEQAAAGIGAMLMKHDHA